MSRLSIAIVLLFVLIVSSATFARTEETENIEQVEKVETVEVIQAVQIVETPSGEDTSMGFVDLVGRFHPASVHMPLGFLVALFVFEILVLLGVAKDGGRTGLILGIMTVLSFIPATLSGFARAMELERLGSASSFLANHRNLMLAMALMALAAVIIRWKKRDRLEGTFKIAYMVLLCLSVLAALAGGHLGGKMVFGENFLPF